MRLAILAFMLGIFSIGYTSSTSDFEQEMSKGDTSEWRAYLIKELKLTKSQANEIFKIKGKYRPELRALLKSKWRLSKELDELAHETSKSPDHRKLLEEKHQAMQDAEEAYEDKHFEMLMEAREVLRPEQIANLDDVLKKRWHYHKWRHEKRTRQAQDMPHSSGE